jgi:predicted DCC family thiol-disulfide oxidoreductase YuxK
MYKLKSYSPYQFSFFRIILGVYLFIHFTSLIPYAAEIWSSNGIFPNPAVNLTYGFFPNILYYISSPVGVTIFLSVLSILSVFFMIGLKRPLVSILLWYSWVCLFDRNNLINNPGIPFIGWILLSCAVIPTGEPLSLSKPKTNTKWEMPPILFIGAWVIMSVGYSISGFDKFQSPSWRDGTAIFHLLENPLARDWWLREFMLSLPMLVLKLKTWISLFLEMAFLPLAIWGVTRKWIWLALIVMHCGILMIVDFADLTIGVLMIHWFTFDGAWLKPKEKHSGLVFFDGICGMCNSFIDFLISEDKGDTLRFTPLQGETGKEKLCQSDLNQIDTIIFLTNDKTFYKSDAVLEILMSIGGIWKIVLVFKIIPKFLRDYIYDFIASSRYKWFGKKESCRIPTTEELNKILP